LSDNKNFVLHVDVQLYICYIVAREMYGIKILYLLHRVLVGPQRLAGQFREHSDLLILSAETRNLILRFEAHS
jgi:hypothetical protein